MPAATSNRAARPLRGLRGESGIERRARLNIVPQLDDAWELFGALGDGAVSPPVSGVLVCDLRLPGTPMFRSRPDWRARLDLGDAPTIIADGPNNRDAAVLSMPFTGLAAGEAVKLEVLDRDLFNKDDFLDAAQTQFNSAFPLVLTGVRRKLHGTCRHLDAKGVSARLTPAVSDASSILAAWSASLTEADLAAADLGYPWGEHRLLEDAIEDVAALVGWAHAELTPLREGFAAGQARWQELARAAAREAVDAAAAPGASVTVGAITVGPAAVHCDGAVPGALTGTAVDAQSAPSCVLEVSVQGAPPALELGSLRLDLLFPDGRTEQPGLLAVDGQRALLDAVLVDSALGRSALKDAVALRITDGRQARFIRLR